jgi:polyhydroxyalkanoate synthesis regulator phasin
MLKEALEDALARGGQIRQEITKDLLSSQFVADLANSPRFINAVSAVIRSKEEVTRTLQKKIKEIMSVMNIPTRQQLRTYEKRVARLERELDAITRRAAKAKASARTTKARKKKATRKKVTRKRKTSTRRKTTRKKTASR